MKAKATHKSKGQTVLLRALNFNLTATMGRPRIYFTPEARQEANRAKSQRSYQRCVSFYY